ncbi:MAG TPA: hypothetical protein VJM11_11685, partial [Nevskiaceae bacterium]|nr:hypothetical protein [Nevskiaceae bacterium]
GVARGHCELSAEFSIAELAELAAAPGLRAGACAVIETVDGGLSYWALAHGGERPDFHDPASFSLRIGPA